MVTSHPCLRRATNTVLVAVALLSGAILLLGDRFDPARSYALSQPAYAEGHIAACVAEENMRLITLDRERCDPGELELASDRRHASAAAGPAGQAGADGVSGYEIVTAKLAVGGRAAAAGEARCPAGKVGVGGGVLPDADGVRPGATPEDRMEVVVSGPLLPSGQAGGYGWMATVKNTGASPLTVVVAAICVTLR